MYPLWVVLVTSAISGVISAILAPLITARLHMKNWQRQKRQELHYHVFREAVEALARLSSDALDVSLQAEGKVYEGVQPLISLRLSTAESLETSRGMVSAFFQQATAESYERAQHTKISIENVPNLECEEARVNTIKTDGTGTWSLSH